jgi:nitrate/TMAO reductase-like tetraheme cytochrome c subunit
MQRWNYAAVTQLEPWEKVLVAKDFLTSIHGELACTDCHGGNGAAADKKTAHQGFDPHPSINNPEGTCGDCHEEIVATAKDSLHATLSTFSTVLKTRADMAKWPEIDAARQGHCAACHQAQEIHAAAPPDLKGRYYLKELVACIDCHQGLEYGSVRDHAIHFKNSSPRTQRRMASGCKSKWREFTYGSLIAKPTGRHQPWSSEP